jgi:hypothetical protein
MFFSPLVYASGYLVLVFLAVCMVCLCTAFHYFSHAVAGLHLKGETFTGHCHDCCPPYPGLLAEHNRTARSQISP